VEKSLVLYIKGTHWRLWKVLNWLEEALKYFVVSYNGVSDSELGK
jgi:hypothetical protein